MKSIILILPYFGEWPVWFEAHLLSIAKNPTIHWLIVTDCDIPKVYPDNITFKTTQLQNLNKHVNQVVDASVPLTPRKFCDLKPAYGDIFNEDIKGYDFWGFCDMDIIWGDIRKFITDEMLDIYDVISSRKEAISGHFNLFRNTPKLNKLYEELPNYKILIEKPKLMRIDEELLTNYLKSEISKNQLHFKVFWETILCNQERGRDSHQEYYLDRWQWQDGKMVNTHTKQEVMYLHFINWKRTMKSCEIRYTDQPERFFISYSKIHYKKHNAFQKLWNSFTNVFDGYYVREKRRIKKKKINSLIKRINRKLQK
jgi:hypothetical protein